MACNRKKEHRQFIVLGFFGCTGIPGCSGVPECSSVPGFSTCRLIGDFSWNLVNISDYRALSLFETVTFRHGENKNKKKVKNNFLWLY